MKTVRLTIILSLSLVLGFSSCIRQQKTWILQDTDTKNVKKDFTNPKNTSYKIHTGDNLYINIYSTDQATSTYFQTNFPTVMSQTYLYLNSYIVNEEGYLTFSFIDKMYVKGLSVEEIQKQLQTTMNSYFKDVTVSVKMVSFFVSVIGEVNNEGKYNIPEEQTNLLEAIALASGFNEFANREKVMLVRQTESGSEVHYLNLYDKDILGSDYFYLQPNDVIYVQSLKSKSFAYEKLPYGVFLSTISIAIAILAFLK